MAPARSPDESISIYFSRRSLNSRAELRGKLRALMSSSAVAAPAADVLLFCCCMAINAEMAVVPRSLSSARWALVHSRAGSG